MSGTVRVQAHARCRPSTGPRFDLSRELRGMLAHIHAEDEVRDAAPGSPEELAALRDLALILVDKCSRRGDAPTRVLAEIAATSDADIVRTLISIMEKAT